MVISFHGKANLTKLELQTSLGSPQVNRTLAPPLRQSAQACAATAPVGASLRHACAARVVTMAQVLCSCACPAPLFALPR